MIYQRKNGEPLSEVRSANAELSKKNGTLLFLGNYRLASQLPYFPSVHPVCHFKRKNNIGTKAISKLV